MTREHKGYEFEADFVDTSSRIQHHLESVNSLEKLDVYLNAMKKDGREGFHTVLDKNLADEIARNPAKFGDDHQKLLNKLVEHGCAASVEKVFELNPGRKFETNMGLLSDAGNTRDPERLNATLSYFVKNGDSARIVEDKEFLSNYVTEIRRNESKMYDREYEVLAKYQSYFGLGTSLTWGLEGAEQREIQRRADDSPNGRLLKGYMSADERVVKDALDRGADIQVLHQKILERDDLGRSRKRSYSKEALNPKILDILVEKGLVEITPDLIIQMFQKQEPSKDMVDFMVKHRVPMQSTDTFVYQRTPLGILCDQHWHKSQLEIIEYFLDNGGKADAYEPRDVWRPIVLAAQHRDTNLMRLLADKGADIMQRIDVIYGFNQNGTPIMENGKVKVASRSIADLSRGNLDTFITVIDIMKERGHHKEAQEAIEKHRETLSSKKTSDGVSFAEVESAWGREDARRAGSTRQSFVERAERGVGEAKIDRPTLGRW